MKMVFGAQIHTAAFLAALGLPVITLPATAQVTLRGKVVDSEVGTALAGATVQVGRAGPILRTDSAGVFVARDVTPGVQEISIKQIGFEEGVFDLRIGNSGVMEGIFPLDFNGVELPAVVVEARAEALAPRYADFERRRRLSMGAFLRWDELKQKNFTSIGDALRTVRGVRMQCAQDRFECYAFMARTPQCQPTWYIDGVEVRSFHENTPIRDVYGIEIYRGPGEIPGEFGGSDAGCGVIVVWTKSKPYR